MYNNKGSFIWRVIGVLLLIGLVIGGGVVAYRAGVAQGVAQSPEVAAAISDAAGSGSTLPMPEYGFAYHRIRPHFGVSPFAGIFGFILLIFLFFGLMRMLFFRPWAWHYGHGPGWWKGYGHPWAHEDSENEGESKAEKED